MSGMDDLVTWLRAQLDEDEQRISGSGTLGWLTYRRLDGSMAYTIPAALAEDGATWVAVGAVARDYASAVVVHREVEALAEVAAKRRILDEAVRLMTYDGEFQFLQLLALPYAERPGYREEWEPV